MIRTSRFFLCPITSFLTQSFAPHRTQPATVSNRAFHLKIEAKQHHRIAHAPLTSSVGLNKVTKALHVLIASHCQSSTRRHTHACRHTSWCALVTYRKTALSHRQNPSFLGVTSSHVACCVACCRFAAVADARAISEVRLASVCISVSSTAVWILHSRTGYW